MLTEAQLDIVCYTNRLLVRGDLERTEERSLSTFITESLEQYVWFL